MKLFAVMSHKGGVGKTTSAVFLAEELAAKGYRTLLVDADRQQGAGLLLEIGTPTGDVQPTRLPGLSYMGSAKFTSQEVATRAAAASGQFDIGVVDTPSLDDSLAQAWLQQAHATLMIMQVEPLTVKTFPSALATLESVRRLNPKIEIVGLLPTVFDPSQETHRTCLTELLTRKPEAVFTPVVPADPGLMHRAAGAGAPEISAAARQAYQVAADRIIRVLNPTRSGTGAAAAAPAWETQAPAAWAAPAPAAPANQASHGGGRPADYPAQGFDVGGGFPPPAAPYAAAAPAPADRVPAPQAWVAGAPPQQVPHAPMAYPSQPAPAFDQPGAPPSEARWSGGAPQGPYGMNQPVPSDEHAPDWWQGAQEQEPETRGGRRANRGTPGRERRGAITHASRGGARGDRSSRPADYPETRAGGGRPAWAPFALGFAAACILLLLAWVGGVFRKVPVQSPKPGVTPAQAAPAQKKAARRGATARLGHAVVGEAVVGEQEERDGRESAGRREKGREESTGKE